MKEGVNFGGEDSSENTSSTKKKKNLGHIAAESSDRRRESSRSEEKPERKSIFDSFDEQNPSKSDAAEKPPAKVERLPEGPASEAEAPPSEIGEKVEKPAIVQELAETRGEAVEAEVTDGSPESEAAKAAAREYYAEAEKTGDPEAAYQEVLNVVDANNEKPTELSETDEAEAVESGAETDPNVDVTETEEFPEEGELIIDRSSETESEAEEVEDEEPTPLTPPTPPISSTPPPPPFGPGSTGGRSGFGGPGSGGPAHFGGGLNPNSAPIAPAATPNVAPRAPEYDAGNPAVAALIGGIVGYLIGRRRGRIKTEKKLLPIQKKLEKQVVDLDWQLREKESKIRQIAAEQVRSKGVAAAERIRQQVAERQQMRQLETARVIERRPAPEAHHLHSSKRPEQIGHMLVAAEAPIIARQSKATGEIADTVHRLEKKPDISPEAAPMSGKRIETLNRAELMSLSEKIIVDGSSLRQIYESHLIGERGLRRLVGEHLKGGDLKKALRMEIVEREIDFERDPAMRDMGGATTTVSTTAGGKAALDSLLQKAAAGLPSGNEEAAFFKARARYEAVQHEQEKKQRRIVDISLTAVIVSLISAVVYIFLTRG